jgi:hypothetical protein
MVGFIPIRCVGTAPRARRALPDFVEFGGKPLNSLATITQSQSYETPRENEDTVFS